MPEKIFITGHKNPDLDSIAAAIAYADLKNKTDNSGNNYVPAAPGVLNAETEYVLEKFGIAGSGKAYGR
jgi:manganese-dependent inorganic pyrophosphatase